MSTPVGLQSDAVLKAGTIFFGIIAVGLVVHMVMAAPAQNLPPLEEPKPIITGDFSELKVGKLEVESLTVGAPNSPYKITAKVAPNGAWFTMSKTGDKGHIVMYWHKDEMIVLVNESGNGDTSAGVGTIGKSAVFQLIDENGKAVVPREPVE